MNRKELCDKLLERLHTHDREDWTLQPAVFMEFQDSGAWKDKDPGFSNFGEFCEPQHVDESTIYKEIKWLNFVHKPVAAQRELSATYTSVRTPFNSESEQLGMPRLIECIE